MIPVILGAVMSQVLNEDMVTSFESTEGLRMESCRFYLIYLKYSTEHLHELAEEITTFIGMNNSGTAKSTNYVFR